MGLIICQDDLLFYLILPLFLINIYDHKSTNVQKNGVAKYAVVKTVFEKNMTLLNPGCRCDIVVKNGLVQNGSCAKRDFVKNGIAPIYTAHGGSFTNGSTPSS